MCFYMIILVEELVLNLITEFYLFNNKKGDNNMPGLIPLNLRNNSLTRIGPFGDFYNIFDDFFNDRMAAGQNLLRETFRIDVAEKENGYVIEAELPGVKKEEIELNTDKENLCISVNSSQDSEKTEGKYIHKERRAASMNRTIRLPGVDMDSITAKLENGVLSICVQKDTEKNTKRIEIA